MGFWNRLPFGRDAALCTLATSARVGHESALHRFNLRVGSKNPGVEIRAGTGRVRSSFIIGPLGWLLWVLLEPTLHRV